jgi:LmbE family N-acetylglucosaminyl deacetylase
MKDRRELAGAVRWLGIGDAAELAGPVAVVSPHLDDAALSLGAAIAHAARRGVAVTVVTVFAGDPASPAPANSWDARAGFRSAAEATAARRAEDMKGCALLGATPAWLPFADTGYGRQLNQEAIGDALAAAVNGSRTVLTPGFPLEHPDHSLVTELVLRLPSPEEILLYVEQPYVLWTSPSAQAPLSDRVWQLLAANARDRLVKVRACRAYASQLPLLGDRVLRGIARYEAARGGEAVTPPVANGRATYAGERR